MLWLKYGLFLGDTPLIMVNVVGALLSFYSMLVFYLFTKEKVSLGRLGGEIEEEGALQCLALSLLFPSSWHLLSFLYN